MVRQHSSCNDNTDGGNGQRKRKLVIIGSSEFLIMMGRPVGRGGVLPLFDRQMRSMPFRCSAMRASSQNDSLILKSHSGDISKQAILLRDAYDSACLDATCRLNAKCNLLPTNTFGTPGACCRRKLKGNCVSSYNSCSKQRKQLLINPQ